MIKLKQGVKFQVEELIDHIKSREVLIYSLPANSPHLKSKGYVRKF